MTAVRRGRYEFAFLLAGALGMAMVWIGKPVGAQPQEDNMRQRLEALRASTLNGPGHAPSGTAGAMVSATLLGNQGDTYVPGDYDGDGRADIAIFSGPRNGTWFVLPTTGGNIVQQWGQMGDITPYP